MKNNNINTRRLRLAEVRYFDEERNATEIPVEKAYVLLAKVNDTYVNIFNPVEELPVYGRLPYTNTTRDGEDYGTKIALESGEVQDGPCWVLTSDSVSSLLGSEEVTMGELESFVIRSDMFFVDRIGLLEDMVGSARRRYNNRKKIEKDMESLDRLNEYFASQGKGIQYRKEN